MLLPGLVNAHTHLEYTALRGFLEDVPFFPWVRALLASKSALGGDDWLWSARLGALESVAAGTTTIGDNTDAGVTMRVAAETGLRAIIYQEVFGIDPRQPVPEIMADLRAKIAAHRGLASERVQVGVSPHALYTVRPELMVALNAYVADEKLPTSIHIAESPAESELTERGGVNSPRCSPGAASPGTCRTPRRRSTPPDSAHWGRTHSPSTAFNRRRTTRICSPQPGPPSPTAPRAMPNSARGSPPCPAG